MKEKVKIITHAVDRGTDHDTDMWFVSVDAKLSSRWEDGSYWQGWIEAEVSRALGFDWLEELRAGHQVRLCQMKETLFAATLTRRKA